MTSSTDASNPYFAEYLLVQLVAQPLKLVDPVFVVPSLQRSVDWILTSPRDFYHITMVLTGPYSPKPTTLGLIR